MNSIRLEMLIHRLLYQSAMYYSCEFYKQALAFIVNETIWSIRRRNS